MSSPLRILWQKARCGRLFRRLPSRGSAGRLRRPLLSGCAGVGRGLGPPEHLEERTPLAIVWANELSTDAGLNALGADEPLARTIINRAIDDWNSVILDFNYDRDNNPTTDNTFELEVYAFPFPNGTRGFSMVTEVRIGAPSKAIVVIDNDGGGTGWFFDDTPADDAEFSDGLTDLFQASIAGQPNETSDLYRTVVHELGHAVGIAGDAQLRLQQFLTFAGTDQVNHGSTLNVFHNPNGRFGSQGFAATLTSSGGGHVYEGPVDPLFPSAPTHPNDLLNPGRSVSAFSTTRQLISDVDVKILVDAYDYDTVLPSQANTFQVVLDSRTGQLFIQDAKRTGQVDLTFQPRNEELEIGVNGSRERVAVDQITAFRVVGDVVLDSQSILMATIGQAAISDGTGLIALEGTVDLNNSRFEVSLETFPSTGDDLVLVNNDGTDPINGQLEGLPDDSVFYLNVATSSASVPVRINYQGGDGNDVVLTVVDYLTPPAVLEVSPDVRTRAVDEVMIRFDGPVVGFNVDDLTLTRDGREVLLIDTATLQSADGATYVLKDLQGLTDQPGSYQLTLNATDVGIMDVAGNSLGAGATVTWNDVREAGDANTDGRFDQTDIVATLQAGSYENGRPANWSSGDWNTDGQFDRLDIVAALVSGHYMQGPYA